MPLTDIKVKNAQPADKKYKLTDHRILDSFKRFLYLVFCTASGFLAFIFLLSSLSSSNKSSFSFELFLVIVFSAAFYFSIKKYCVFVKKKKLETIQKNQSEKPLTDIVLENKTVTSPISKKQKFELNALKALLVLIGVSSSIICFPMAILAVGFLQDGHGSVLSVGGFIVTVLSLPISCFTAINYITETDSLKPLALILFPIALIIGHSLFS